jgi:hypothetical protein
MQDSSTGTTTRAPAWWCYSAISTVYTYADAVVKTFAAAAVAVDLVALSSLYGLQPPSVVAWMGVLERTMRLLSPKFSKLLSNKTDASTLALQPCLLT